MTLHYGVTPTYDFLTSNVWSVPAVARSYSVPIFSKIEQSTAELLWFK